MIWKTLILMKMKRKTDKIQCWTISTWEMVSCYNSGNVLWPSILRPKVQIPVQMSTTARFNLQFRTIKKEKFMQLVYLGLCKLIVKSHKWCLKKNKKKYRQQPNGACKKILFNLRNLWRKIPTSHDEVNIFWSKSISCSMCISLAPASCTYD